MFGRFLSVRGGPLIYRNSPFRSQARKREIWVARLVTVAIVGVVLLSGCVPVAGPLAKQAANFNMSAANAQDDTLLMNIVRAAYRYPMHYSLVTTLSETGTVTFGGTLTLPFAPFHNGVDQYNVAPTAQVQISPVLNMSLVETKEFYNGMLAPLSLQEIALFSKEGVQPSELYTLAFGAIVIRRNGKNKRAPILIKNDFYPVSGDAARFCGPSTVLFGKHLSADPVINGEQCFEKIMQALDAQSLTIESGDKQDDSGLPAFPEPMLREGKIYSAILAHSLKATRVKADDCVSKGKDEHWLVKKKCRDWLSDKDADRLGGGEAFYRLMKVSTTYGVCFDQMDGSAVGAKLASAQCEDVRQKTTKSAPRLYEFFVPSASREPQAKAKGKGKEPESFTFGFEPRSTEGIIYYLGEIARCYLQGDPKFAQSDLSHGAQFSGCSGVEISTNDYENTDDPESCTNLLFRLNSINMTNDKAVVHCGTQPVQLPHSGSRMTVNWNGTKYWVDVDSSGRDRSASVLRILTQMIALNQSEKSLPAPSVVPVLVH